MAMYSRRSRPRHRTVRRPHEYLTNPDLPTYRVPAPEFQGLPLPDFPPFPHMAVYPPFPPIPPFPLHHNYTHSPSHSPSPPYLDRRSHSDEDTIVLVIQKEADPRDDDQLQECELFYPYGTIFDGKVTVGGIRREVERQLRDEGGHAVVELYFRNRLLDDDSRLLVEIGLESGDEIFVKVLDRFNVSLQREAEIERRRLESERLNAREAERRMEDQRELDRLERERLRVEDLKEFERLERERAMEQREYQRRMESGMRPLHTPPEDDIPRRHRADGALPSSYQEESRMSDAGRDRFSSSYQEESRMRDAARQRRHERELRMQQHEAECQAERERAEAEAHRAEKEREKRIREREERLREHEAAEAARRGRQSQRQSREPEEHRHPPEEEAAAEEYRKHFHMPPPNSQQGDNTSSVGSSPDLDGTSSETSYNQSTTSRRSRYSHRSHSKLPPSTRAEPPPPPHPIDDAWSTLNPPTLLVPPKFQTTEEAIRTFRASNKSNIFPVIDKFVDSTLNNTMSHRAELKKNPQWVKFHRMLSDIVSSLMCDLDNLDINGDEVLRTKRKEVIKEMEGRGSKLDDLMEEE